MSWLSRFLKMINGEPEPRPKSREPKPRDLDVSTGDYPTPTSLPQLPGSIKLSVGIVSTVGNHREHNEDNFFVPGHRSIVHGGSTESSTEMPAVLEAANLFVVADGMGGQQAGEEASRMAVEIIPKALERRLAKGLREPKFVQTAIRDSVAEANQEILGTSGTVVECSNMGTTVVLALFWHDKLFVAGIGDSRAYRLRDGVLEQLTKDHSLADALLDAGTISKEELANHKFKNILYLYLGSKDARGGPDEVRVLDVKAGDRVLLASDGLTGVVDDDEIVEILSSYGDPQRSAKALKDRALDNDSKDNVTCLVVHVIRESNAY